MKKTSMKIFSGVLIVAVVLGMRITANNYNYSYAQPFKSGIAEPNGVVQTTDNEANLSSTFQFSQKDETVELSDVVINEVLNPVVDINTSDAAITDITLTDTSVIYDTVQPEFPELPYPVATNEELWDQWNAIWLRKLSGGKMTSQTKEVKDFMRSAMVRMCDDPRFNFNFDYDYINDLVYDDDLKGLAKIGFDYDSGQGIYYSAMNPWNRQAGYCLEYDAIAPITSTNLDTKRFKFNYNGYDWMIQVWKGQYGGYSTGAEIGVYYREPNKAYFPPSLYNCVPDEMMLDIEMNLYYKDEFLFKRPMQRSWWVTGFVVFQSCKPKDVRIDAKIGFPNEEMLDAFLPALEGFGYVLNESYSIEGNIVVFSY